MKASAILLAATLLAVSVAPSPAAHAQAASTAQKRAAIQKACKSGALSPDECSERLAALDSQSPAGKAPAGGKQQGSYVAGSGEVPGSTEYKDPNGRYSVSVPQGWNVDSSNGNLKISQGETWAIFETTSSAKEALYVAQQAAGQMEPMYQKWQVINQGPFTTHHKHAAAGMTIGATVATKTGSKQVVMLFATQSAGSNHYLTMTSSTDQATGSATNGLLMQVFESVKFGGD